MVLGGSGRARRESNGWRRRGRGLCRGLRGGGSVYVTRLVVLNGLLLEETEDVVENEVAVRLLGEEERLDKLAPWIALI